MSIAIYDGGQLRRIGGAAQAVTAEVFVISGQSNAVGRGERTALPPEVVNNAVPNSYTWNGAAFAPTTIQGVNNYPAPNNDNFGPEVMLSILASAHTGKPVYLVKYGVDNTGLTETSGSSWNTDRSDSLFADFKVQLSAALANLSAAGKTPVVRAFLWAQGERDATISGIGPLYQRQQTRLFNAIRALVKNPVLPILDVLVRGESAGQVYAADINAAKTGCSTAVGNVTLLRSTAMEDRGDDTHYDGAGQLALGRYLFELAYSKRFRLPTSLPPRSFQFDSARQSGYTSGGITKLGTLQDVSGASGTLGYGDATKLPDIREGNWGRGKTALRMLYPGVLERADSPMQADTPYTWYVLLRDFVNYNVSGVKILARSLASGAWLFWFPPSTTGPTDRLHVRHGSNNFMVSSAPSDLGPQLFVIGYGGAAGSYIRRNGVEVATSSVAVPYNAGGPLNLGNVSSSVMGLYAAGGCFDNKLTLAQAQVLEASLMHEYGLAALLPSSHPYKSVSPT